MATKEEIREWLEACGAKDCIPIAYKAEKRIGDLQTRLQQMFAVLKDYRNQEIPAEDAIAALDQRIHSAFKALCGVEK